MALFDQPRQLFARLRPPKAALNAEEQTFVDAWIARHFAAAADAILVIAGIAYLLVTIFAFAFIRFNGVSLGIVHGVIAVAYLGSAAARKHISSTTAASWIGLPAQIGTVLSWGWNLNWALQHGDRFAAILTPPAFIAATSAALITYGGSLRRLRGMTLFYVLIGGLAWGNEPGLPSFLLSLSIGMLTRVIYEEWRIAQLVHEATVEMQQRTRLAQAEKARQEQEFTLAREIQDSFALDDAGATPSAASVTSFHLYHDALGGDWSSWRRLADGTVVAMVMDATGKGVQAALVVHAIQSLWAMACLDAEFDPARWLERVNATLIMMGQNNPQTLTLGIAVVGASEIRYFSAGHVPLVVEDCEAGTVQLLAARGGMLGMDPSLELEPSLLEMKSGRRYSILLASDGVLDGAAVRRRKELPGLLADLRREGEGALRRIPIEDDKIATIIETVAA